MCHFLHNDQLCSEIRPPGIIGNTSPVLEQDCTRRCERVRIIDPSSKMMSEARIIKSRGQNPGFQVIQEKSAKQQVVLHRRVLSFTPFMCKEGTVLDGRGGFLPLLIVVSTFMVFLNIEPTVMITRFSDKVGKGKNNPPRDQATPGCHHYVRRWSC